MHILENFSFGDFLKMSFNRSASENRFCRTAIRANKSSSSGFFGNYLTAMSDAEVYNVTRPPKAEAAVKVITAPAKKQEGAS